jgi:hypothetical protein
LRSPGVALVKTRLLVQKSVTGDFGTIVVSGHLDNPAPGFSPMEFRVAVQPDQAVNVNWTVVCSGNGKASSASGKSRVYSLMAVRVQVPFLGADSCSVSAVASMTGSGRLDVRLLGSQ